MADITSANAILILSVPLLLPVPQQIQGFSTDEIFDTESAAINETLMGVDGILSGGFVYMPRKMTITLQADSASNTFFDAWAQGMTAGVFVAPATGGITLTGIGKAYVMANGFLTGYKPTPDAKKLLQPRKFELTWESITPAPIGSAG